MPRAWRTRRTPALPREGLSRCTPLATRPSAGTAPVHRFIKQLMSLDKQYRLKKDFYLFTFELLSAGGSLARRPGRSMHEEEPSLRPSTLLDTPRGRSGTCRSECCGEVKDNSHHVYTMRVVGLIARRGCKDAATVRGKSTDATHSQPNSTNHNYISITE